MYTSGIAAPSSPTRRRGPAVRERVLAAARRLFERQGINATTLAQIATAAPVSKRTLYAHFSTKDDLVVAYLESLRTGGQTVERALDRVELPARDRLLAVFEPVAGGGELHRGCPFIDAAAEFPDPASPIHAYARAQKQRLRDRFAEVAREARIDSPDDVADQLAVIVDGMASRSMVLDSASPAHPARALARLVIDGR